MIAVEAQNIRKVYRLYESPAARLKEIVLGRVFHAEFVALDDISFSIEAGDTFGIIGENGAGKSTLLKVLARTLRATSGNLQINGRVAALLELGAGFNPELSGEENIYLNAYLLGLSKQEVDRRREEIIAFSELGDFIKRPVKTYSSGMHVRLAFSIATSIDPDVLIIDEALSVGDEHFQKKCVNRMMEFKNASKTIIFCSHNLYQVQELCRRSLWIHGGRMRRLGESGKVILDYQSYQRDRIAAVKEADISGSRTDAPDKTVTIRDLRVTDKNGLDAEAVFQFDVLNIKFRICCREEGREGHVGFLVIRNDETLVFGTLTSLDGLAPCALTDGREFGMRIERLTMLPGIYCIAAVVADDFALHTYDVARSKPFVVTSKGRELGVCYIDHSWGGNG